MDIFLGFLAGDDLRGDAAVGVKRHCYLVLLGSWFRNRASVSLMGAHADLTAQDLAAQLHHVLAVNPFHVIFQVMLHIQKEDVMHD